MTHEELLAKMDEKTKGDWNIITDDLELPDMELIKALRAVVELHKPIYYPDKPDKPDGPVWCNQCAEGRGYAKYPCPTIQAIEKELK
jgi:hypothetical protein